MSETDDENTIELLNKQLNTVSALRKLTFFEIEQPKGTFCMRPQLHVLIVKPFGMIKSGNIQQFEEVLKDDVVIRDELTKPAILGTISKDKTYVAGLPGEIGGKVLVLDEFNNIEAFGQKALLGILENQRINRQLGFAVSEPQTIRPNEWTDLSVTNGSIEGTVNFSCIAFAMFYPKPKNNSLFEENPQSLLGLKSRFCPNFSCPEHSELMDALRGGQAFKLKYYGLPVRRVFIEKDAYSQYIDFYAKFTERFVDTILEKDQVGFLTRVSSDILRFAAHEVMDRDSPQNTMLKISDAGVLIDQAEKWTEELLKQYMYEERAGTYEEFAKLYNERPNEANRLYAQRLNKSIRQIQRWKKRLAETQLVVERDVVT